MNLEIRQRIEQIKNGEVPEGYRYSRAGLSPNDWGEGSLSDVLYNEQRAIPKPNEGYWRIGIRSHAKGTFHEYVENPETVDMDELYIVKENDLILNITFAWEHAVALADKDDDGLLVSHRFPTYVFREGQNPIFYKSIAIQKRFKEMLGLISPGGAGRNRVMSKKDFLRLPCNIPSSKEQQKIAEILIQCDKVIELKQKRIDEEKRKKQAMLKKVFVNNNSIEYSLCNLCTTIIDGDWIESKDQSEDGIRLIQTGNIGVGRYFEKEKAAKYISDETFKTLNCTEVFDGDVLISRLPDPIGRACMIRNLKTRAITAVDCTIMRFKEQLQAELFLQYATTQEYFNKLQSLAGGSTRTRISRKELEKLKVKLPKEDKRARLINDLFKQQDRILITLEKELEQWQQKKKSLMQLLLTGIVRCEDDRARL